MNDLNSWGEVLAGSGGNRRYLQSLGFKNVLTVDWIAAGADLLVDAHRLPLASGAFDMVISTAVFEHLYNPFLAIGEIGRVLKTGGCFVGGANHVFARKPETTS